MARRPRRQHDPDFKARVALAALQGNDTLAGLAATLDLHPNLVRQWRDQLLESAAAVFSTSLKSDREMQALQSKVEDLTKENDFLERALANTGWLGA